MCTNRKPVESFISAVAILASMFLMACESAPVVAAASFDAGVADNGNLSNNDVDAGITGTDDAQPDSSTDVAQTQPDIQAPAPCGGSCDDGNVCTTDICSAADTCVHVNVVVVCSDGNACTVNDSCNNLGICAGVTSTCSDGDACTTDSCNPASGCAFTGVTCNDGDLCTDDVCDKTLGCKSTPKTCNDNNSCTSDLCGTGGLCLHVATVGACDDNNLCTTGDACNAAGLCAGVTKSCEDSNPCTDDFCVSGNCSHGVNTAPCNDNNACTSGDACLGAVCIGNTTTCDDGDPCTVDACDKAKGCTTSKVQCNDGNLCTLDTCNALTGACHFDALSCDDGKIWTVDFCDADGYWGNPGACVSYDKAGACQKDTDCTDTNLCTVDVCDSFTGTCNHIVPICTDNDACTTGDTCSKGICAGTAKNCDDSNANTADSCNASTGACVHTPVTPPPATCGSCDDSNAATVDTCSNGVCLHTPVTGPFPPVACYGMFFSLPADTATCVGWPASSLEEPIVFTGLKANTLYTLPDGMCSVTCDGTMPNVCGGQWLNDAPALWSTGGCWNLPGHPNSAPVSGCAWDSKCTPKP